MITRIEVHYPAKKGRIALRGDSRPLSWRRSKAATRVDEGNHVFELDLAQGDLLEFKVIRDEKVWAAGRNQHILAGESIVIEPYFDHATGTLEPELHRLPFRALGRDVAFRLFLPPSYDEHPGKRYPVLYAQDGQNQFTPDPIDGHSWEMDSTLNELYELDVVEEIIVVAIHTDLDRIAMLSPSRDRAHGGGKGPAYRDWIITQLKPWVDANYRTRPGRDDTALIGSSMGGLFSFFAAWTRNDVFGKAACLSGSFWWNNRWMIREAQKGSCPFPRPWLYLDSGAASSAFEEDANLQDGFHHTMALRNALVEHCYVPGSEIHALAFAGMRHDNASWAARLSIPLQLLFPRRVAAG